MTQWHPHALAAFEMVFRPWMKRRIPHVYTTGRAPEAGHDHCVILAANHVSWWDGFMLRELHRKHAPDVPLITPMLESEWRKNRISRFVGTMPLDPSPISIRRAVADLRERRRAGSFWMSFFPQGQIYPSFKRPLEFRRGIELMVEAVHPCTVVPVALHFEPLNHPGMSAFVGIGAPMRGDASFSAGALEWRVEAMLDRMESVLSVHGEEAGPFWEAEPVMDLAAI